MRKKRRHNLSSDEISRIAHFYFRGSHTNLITRTFNISTSTIRNLVQEGKISKRPAVCFRTINPETIAKVISMYLEGEKLVYIAHILKIGQTSVHRIITKQNIKRNRRK
jgi:DNA invertase Pin-like site-specific DNA recombinase